MQSFVLDGKGIVKAEKAPILSKEYVDPDYYMIFDPSIADPKMFREGSIAVFNSPAKVVSPKLKAKKVKSYFVDATGISMTHIKLNKPAMPVIGTIPKVFGKITMKSIKNSLESEGLEKSFFTMLDDGYKSVK